MESNQTNGEQNSLFHERKALVYYDDVWEEDQKGWRRITVAGVVKEIDGDPYLLIGYTVFNPKDKMYSKKVGREEATKNALYNCVSVTRLVSRRGLIHNFVQLAKAVANFTNKTCYHDNLKK